MNTAWTKPVPSAKQANLLKTILVLLMGVFCAQAASATTWYTLRDGNYLNTTDVWSMNGIDPCGCTPGMNIPGVFDTVNVNHAIVLDTDIRLGGRSEFFVAPGASLIGPYDLLIANASFTNRGTVSAVDVTLNLGGHFFAINNTSISGNVVNNNARIELAGNLSIDGNLENRDGYIQIFANAEMYVGGRYNNDGVTDIAPGGCVNIIADFLNPARGQVNGGGYVRSFQNIVNNGFWDANVSWCAEGTATGMPTPPNCVNCGALPVELLSFDAVYRSDEQLVELKWNTSYELNNDFFTIERSTDGQTFELVNIVPGAENAADGAQYATADYQPVMSEVIYRLRQTDKDGSQKVIGMVQVNASGNFQADLKLYPNPFQDRVQYSFSNSEATALSMVVMDLSGRQLLNSEVSAERHFHHGDLDLSVLPAGSYLLEMRAGNVREVRKLVKQ